MEVAFMRASCIVHLIRNSLSFCNWKERRPVALELKRIYNAETAELAAKRLEEFAQSPWGKKLSPIVQSWRRVWEQVIPFFAYPLELRKIIYTTNAIESLHMQLRKVLKTRGHFPSDEAATQFAIQFGDFLRLRPTKEDDKSRELFPTT
jgi:transposase-like protein